MEEKKINLSTALIIIALVVMIVMGIFIYKINNEKNIEVQKNADLQQQVSSLNNTINSLQEKLNTISETVNNTTSTTDTTNTTNVTNTTNTTSEKENPTNNNTNNNNEKIFVADARPTGFAGSSMNRVVLYSNGEAYLIRYDGDGESEDNISTVTLIAKKATLVETCKDESDENYGSVIIKAKEIVNDDIEWIVFK